MVGDILTALTRYEMVVGALVAGGLLLGFALLNKWQRWWVSSDLLASEKARADEARSDAAEAVTRAHVDADAKVISMRDAMKERSQEDREDGLARAAQVRADSQAELDRLLKVVEAIQREVESWRQAFHLADQANREEDDARWNQIQSALTVLERFVTEVQRQVLATRNGRELEAGRDGGGADVR